VVGSLETPSSEGFWLTAISSPGHATTPVAAAQSQAPSITSFASANTYHTLDNATTDDESANLLTAPDLPVDLPTMVFPVEDVDLTASELLDVGGPPIDPRDGNAIATALRCLDEKWTTILTNYNNVLKEKRSHDDEQRRCDEEKRTAPAGPRRATPDKRGTPYGKEVGLRSALCVLERCFCH
jgi:hypothetical protein